MASPFLGGRINIGVQPYIPPAPPPGGSGLFDTSGSIRRGLEERAAQATQGAGQAALQALFGYGPGTPGTAINPISPSQAGITEITKSPDIELDLNNLLGRARTTNQAELVREPRSVRADTALQEAFARFRGDTQNTDQSLRDFVDEFLSVRPQQREAAQEDVAALAKFFGGAEDPSSLAGQLAGNLDARRRAVAQNVRRALGTVERSGKVGRLLGGNSSYLQRQLLDSAAAILADEARQGADIGRSNILDVAGIQAGTAGRRQSILDDLVRSGLLPVQAQQAVTTNQLAQLAQLLGPEMANTIVERRGDQLARELGLLGGAAGLRDQLRAYLTQAPTIDTGKFNYLPFDEGQDFDLDSLARLLGVTGGQNLPTLTDQSGQSVAGQTYNPLYDTLGSGTDVGAGSLASLLGLEGTTFETPEGEFIRGPYGNQAVGPDRLTDLQRLFD